MDRAYSLVAVLSDPAARADLRWEPFRTGVEIAWVRRPDVADGPSAAFLRYAPGARVPRHHHDACEYILVIEGAQSDTNGNHAAGTLVVNPAGTEHAVASPEGCLVLAIWEKPVRFV